MANNRVWLVCRGEHDVPEFAPTQDDPWPDRMLMAKHFVDGWERRQRMRDLWDWLERHRACFWDRQGLPEYADGDQWDHQFELEYEA